MDTTLDPRWQAALDHSRYLTNLFFARPELIAELAASWEQPLSEQLLQAPFVEIVRGQQGGTNLAQ